MIGVNLPEMKFGVANQDGQDEGISRITSEENPSIPSSGEFQFRQLTLANRAKSGLLDKKGIARCNAFFMPVKT